MYPELHVIAVHVPVVVQAVHVPFVIGRSVQLEQAEAPAVE